MMRSYYEKRTLPAKDSNVSTPSEGVQLAFDDDIDDEESENRITLKERLIGVQGCSNYSESSLLF